MTRPYPISELYRPRPIVVGDTVCLTCLRSLRSYVAVPRQEMHRLCPRCGQVEVTVYEVRSARQHEPGVSHPPADWTEE